MRVLSAIRSFLCTTILLGGFALCPLAAQGAGVAIPHGTVELISENSWISAGHSVNLGLRFQLEQGWHIYWVNPGDSGEPPRVKWQMPAGLTVGTMEWPAPHRLGSKSVTDFGYQDAVTLIVPIRAEKNFAARSMTKLGADVRVLVCREMCLPGKAQVSLTLPVKAQAPATDAQNEDSFAATRKLLPKPALASWKFSVADTKGSFVLAAKIGRRVTQANFYPLQESQIDNAAVQLLEPTADGLRLTLKKSDQLMGTIERLKGVLVVAEGQAYLIDVPVGATASRNSGAGNL
jgi:DsbC/DsbD-like thiol-disulfide interchange protein